MRTSARVGLFAAGLAAVFAAAYGTGHAVGPIDTGSGRHAPRPAPSSPGAESDGTAGMADMPGMAHTP